MKISSRIEGSLCGAILSPRRALWSSNGTGADDSRAVHGGGQWRSRRRQQQRVGTIRRPSASSHRRAENDFFTPWIPPPVLVKALPYTSRASGAKADVVAAQKAKPWRPPDDEKTKRKHATKGPDDLPHQPVLQNKEEMLALVDQVQKGTVNDYLAFQRDPYMRGYAPADGPEVTVSERVDDNNFPDFSEVHSGGDPIQHVVEKLWRAINRRLSNPYNTNIESIYSLYRRLPEPRIPYLHSRIRHRLMEVLGREEKNRISMLRYFQAVADIKEAGLRLTRKEWNSTLSFAARWVGHSQDKETDATLRLWKEMESEAGVKSNAVTFNILFDVASKAGNFILAEKLYREMDKRKLPWNRYHHVSLIHFFGLKMDSDGIRAAYKELVEAGELVDTVVLNCVIAGFLRCGEEYAAERVYERMRTAHLKVPTMPYRNYMKDEVITKVLMMFAKISKEAENKGSKAEAKAKAQDQPAADSKSDVTHGSNADLETADMKKTATEESKSNGLGVSDDDLHADAQGQGEGQGDGGALRKLFQKQSPIVPDIQTYRILLNHYAVRLASLDKVAYFLNDMKSFQVPLHGTVFLALFKGFALYGGPGQQWDRERLNTVYGAFQNALAENANGMYVDIWMARWILRAFRKCDTEDRLWEVWDELKPRCETDFEAEDIGKFEDFLVNLMNPEQQHRGYPETGMFGQVGSSQPRSGWR